MTDKYRTVPADEVIATFSPERRKKIDASAAELIAEARANGAGRFDDIQAAKT